MPAARPDAVRLIICVATGLAGCVFILQGLGAPIGRSFMIGDLRWTVIGAVMVVAALGVALRELRNGR